jgi:hypothetical protein
MAIHEEDAQSPDLEPRESAADDRPFQFTLRQLLLFVAVLSVIFGLLASLGIAVNKAREAARAAACLSRLNQLGLALKNYHHTYGCYPPAYVCDANGKPVHSWRVLILPFIEEQALYARYNFAEPWDGPSNRRLAGASPSVLDWYCQCPSGDLDGTALTDVVAVVGKNTMWPGEKCTRVKEFGPDGPQQILVIEIANSDVHWMEPRDLTLEQALAGIQPEKGLGIGSQHPSGIIYLDAAYGVHVLDRDTDPEELRRLLTVEPEDPLVEFVP